MPLYDYRCLKCDHSFEAFVKHGDAVHCPACGCPEVDRMPCAVKSHEWKFGDQPANTQKRWQGKKADRE